MLTYQPIAQADFLAEVYWTLRNTNRASRTNGCRRCFLWQDKSHQYSKTLHGIHLRWPQLRAQRLWLLYKPEEYFARATLRQIRCRHWWVERRCPGYYDPQLCRKHNSRQKVDHLRRTCRRSMDRKHEHGAWRQQKAVSQLRLDH